MNDSARSFVNAVAFGRASRLLAATALAACLGGCIGNPLAEAKVDPSSPIAAEVTKLAHANTDFPSFSEIPAAPNDVRPVKMFGQAANDLDAERAKLERETAPETWHLAATDAFAAKARREVGPDLPPAENRNTEAYAAELRKRATPPPPPKR